MIVLTKTTQVLQAVLSGAVATNQPQANVTFYDRPPRERQSFEEYQKASQQTDLNSTTDVSICAAPSQNGTVRNIEYVGIYNKDTASVEVIVKIDEGGTETILVRRTLTTLQTLFYEDGAGWIVLPTA